MKEIQLTRGKVTKVDDSDYEWLMTYKWCSFKVGKHWYAVSRRDGDFIYMHKLIMSTIGKERVDHVNQDGLDNQRINLRRASQSQNLANRGMNVNNTSGYKGVSWNSQKQKWYARIKVQYEYHFLGYFDDIKVAALAYNKSARAHFGEFAFLNEVVQ